MNEEVKFALWTAVATCVGVLLAKVISNTGVIEKIVPKKDSFSEDNFESDEPVLYV